MVLLTEATRCALSVLGENALGRIDMQTSEAKFTILVVIVNREYSNSLLLCGLAQ